MSPFALTDLTHYFQAQSESRQWPSLIDIRQAEGDASVVELDMLIDPSLEYFDGHFPDQPVLPGVVQIHWAGECAKRLFNLRGFSTLQGTKFNGMVLPSTTLSLKLTFKAEKSSVRFDYFNAEHKFSAGSLVFSETPSKET